MGEKPVCLNNLPRKGLPVKAQAVVEKEMGALTRAGISKPLKKADKLDVSANSVAVKSVKKTRTSSRKEDSVIGERSYQVFHSHVAEVLLGQL